MADPERDGDEPPDGPLDGPLDGPREDEELVVLPDQTADDTDRGWGERADSNDERLLAERPPHWD